MTKSERKEFVEAWQETENIITVIVPTLSPEVMFKRPEGESKLELIHKIQSAEGNHPCYGKGMFVCNNLQCCWRQSCCEDKC